MFNKKVSEVPFWWIVLTFGIAVALLILWSEIRVSNIVVTANNGSFIKRSFFTPLSLEEKNKAGAAVDKAMADKAAAAAKK